MADARPFNGIRYDPGIVADMGRVTTPPYDVISPEEQEDFHRKHPNNMIRLILGKRHPNDNPDDNPHTRAAAAYRRWREQGILLRDPRPAFYLTAVEFPHEGRTLRRMGLIAAVRLEPFDKGIILPHEATYSAIKSERLGLMKACHANFSPIFSIFPDAPGLTTHLGSIFSTAPADTDFLDSHGHRHRLWRIEDERRNRGIREALEAETLFIADGHHRYETALAYRDWLDGRTSGGLAPDHPARFILMYLSSIRDPGIVIHPAHRIVSGLDPGLLDGFDRRAAADFDVERIAPDGAPAPFGRPPATSSGDDDCCRIGVVMDRGRRRMVLRAKRRRIAERLAGSIPSALSGLDVSILTHLLLKDYLGITATDLDDVERIRYTSRSEAAMEAVERGNADAAFLLQPTPVEEVCRIAEAGHIMPRKTTYFAPKVITGLVLKDLQD